MSIIAEVLRLVSDRCWLEFAHQPRAESNTGPLLEFLFKEIESRTRISPAQLHGSVVPERYPEDYYETTAPDTQGCDLLAEPLEDGCPSISAWGPVCAESTVDRNSDEIHLKLLSLDHDGDTARILAQSRKQFPGLFRTLSRLDALSALRSDDFIQISAALDILGYGDRKQGYKYLENARKKHSWIRMDQNAPKNRPRIHAADVAQLMLTDTDYFEAMDQTGELTGAAFRGVVESRKRQEEIRKQKERKRR